MARGTLPGTLALKVGSGTLAVAAPKIATELNSYTDCIGSANSEGLAELNGWIVNASTIPTPDYLSHTVGTVPGDSVVQDSSMSFYYDSGTTTLYDLLIEGFAGYAVFMFDGETIGEESQVWPFTVQTRFRRPNRDQAHIFDVNFAVGTPTVGTLAT